MEWRKAQDECIFIVSYEQGVVRNGEKDFSQLAACFDPKGVSCRREILKECGNYHEGDIR